ncbi:MAG: tripartite tricarboxylate transporter TctB family protein [Rhizobiaceae bacterium]
MEDRKIQIQLGIGALIGAAILLLIGIPSLVSSPKNVPNIVLSPDFWPNTLSGLTGLVGAGLILTSYWRPKPKTAPPSDVDNRPQAFQRLAMLGTVMGITIFALPRLGLVWTAMLVFASLSFLVRTSHPKTALVCSLIVPLLLYAFFEHVAGIAIPQGDFVRLL